MSLRFESPYENGANLWLRGNLHAHTTNSDGEHTPQKLVDAYAARNYDFLMISDHDVLTKPGTVQSRGMILIPGVEITANGPHILHVNASSCLAPDADRQAVLEGIKAGGGFAIMGHPNWGRGFDHCPQAQLTALQGYTGIEIYNGVIRVLEGSPRATDRWDQLLAGGRRVWGFASDDCHREGDEQVAWMMLQSQERTAAAILKALQAGRFYCTTGVMIYNIALDGDEVIIESENAQKIVAFGDGGMRIAEVHGSEMSFEMELAQGCTYVRFEAYGYGEGTAWTQPFFLGPPQ